MKSLMPNTNNATAAAAAPTVTPIIPKLKYKLPRIAATPPRTATRLSQSMPLTQASDQPHNRAIVPATPSTIAPICFAISVHFSHLPAATLTSSLPYISIAFLAFILTIL